MNKIAYIITGAAVLCFASCTHKQLGKVGMCAKDLLVKYNWEDVYEQSRGDFEDPMDNFLSNFDEIHAHVMPMSTVERIDTTLINDHWGTTRPNNMDHFKSTLFPSRSGKDRAHFAGIYDIFVTAPYDISQMINTTDMHNSIPTTFDFMEYEHPDYGKVIGTSTGINTKATEEPEGIYVPGLNDLPYGDIIGISQLPRIYYGSKKGVVVTPGDTDHEVAETDIRMKRFRAPYIFITFKTSVNCEAIAAPGGMESLSFLITGLAHKYDLLNDKPIGGYNYFIPNPYEYQDGYAVSTNILGISPETGKCEAVLFGVVKKTVNNDILTYFVYAKKDITEDILNCEDDSIQLSLFQDTMTLPQDAVPSVYGKDMVWNEIR